MGRQSARALSASSFKLPLSFGLQFAYALAHDVCRKLFAPTPTLNQRPKLHAHFRHR